MTSLNLLSTSLMLLSSISSSSYGFPGLTPEGFDYEGGDKTLLSFRDGKYCYGYFGTQIYSTSFSTKGPVDSKLYCPYCYGCNAWICCL